MNRELGIGDVIEVRQLVLEGVVARENWRYASICFIDEHRIGVAFKDGTRQMLPRQSGGEKNWR